MPFSSKICLSTTTSWIVLNKITRKDAACWASSTVSEGCSNNPESLESGVTDLSVALLGIDGTPFSSRIFPITTTSWITLNKVARKDAACWANSVVSLGSRKSPSILGGFLLASPCPHSRGVWRWSGSRVFLSPSACSICSWARPSALLRSVPRTSTPCNLAPLNVAPRMAKPITAPFKLAPIRFAPCKLAA